MRSDPYEAAVLTPFGGSEVLTLTEVASPQAAPGHLRAACDRPGQTLRRRHQEGVGTADSEQHLPGRTR